VWGDTNPRCMGALAFAPTSAARGLRTSHANASAPRDLGVLLPRPILPCFRPGDSVRGYSGNLLSALTSCE
jgi:hypothetical protein